MILVVAWGRRWGLVMAAIERCNGSWMDAGDGGVVAMEGWIGYVGGSENVGRGENKRAGDKDDDRWSGSCSRTVWMVLVGGGWVGSAGGQSWRAVDGGLSKTKLLN